MPTVFIVGAGGMVGATVAQALVLKETVHEVVLIDVAEELVAGQAMDINHAAAFTHGVRVRVGQYADIKKDDIVVITCGLPQKPGQSRLDLLEANVAIIRDVVGKIMAQGSEVYLLMVSNPVDILTHVALKISGLPKERVFGTGTTLDTARLRVSLANTLRVSQQEVQAYILGEHGDSSFFALSNASIGGVPLTYFPGFKPEMVDSMEQDIRDAAYKIIAAKKSTYYGIGHVVAKIIEAMMHPTAALYPVCSLASGEYGVHDVVIGLPSLVSSTGISIVDHYPLDAAERERLHNSVTILRSTMSKIAF